MKRTALIHAHDGAGVMEIGPILQRLGFNIIAFDGSREILNKANIETADTARIIGKSVFGERLMAFSPAIHAALVTRNDEDSEIRLAQIGAPRIDLLYAVLRPIGSENIIPPCSIEHTEIDRTAMIRSAVAGRRVIIHRPEQIQMVMRTIGESEYMNGGSLKLSFIIDLASQAEDAVAAFCTRSANIQRRMASELRAIEE